MISDLGVSGGKYGSSDGDGSSDEGKCAVWVPKRWLQLSELKSGRSVSVDATVENQSSKTTFHWVEMDPVEGFKTDGASLE